MGGVTELCCVCGVLDEEMLSDDDLKISQKRKKTGLGNINSKEQTEEQHSVRKVTVTLSFLGRSSIIFILQQE